jgi:hypothetical protein
MADPDLTLALTRAEALVLFEWLAHLDQTCTMSFQHPAEERVLWRLEAQLESMLHEPFDPDYRERLSAARRRVQEM